MPGMSYNGRFQSLWGEDLTKKSYKVVKMHPLKRTLIWVESNLLNIMCILVYIHVCFSEIYIILFLQINKNTSLPLFWFYDLIPYPLALEPSFCAWVGVTSFKLQPTAFLPKEIAFWECSNQKVSQFSQVGVVWWIRISLDMEVKQVVGRNWCSLCCCVGNHFEKRTVVLSSCEWSPSLRNESNSR